MNIEEIIKKSFVGKYLKVWIATYEIRYYNVNGDEWQRPFRSLVTGIRKPEESIEMRDKFPKNTYRLINCSEGLYKILDLEIESDYDAVTRYYITLEHFVNPNSSKNTIILTNTDNIKIVEK